MAKKTMGNNPLEQYLTVREKKEVEKTESTMQESYSIKKKERITIHLPVDLIDRIKNVVYWEPGLTLTAFAQQAFERALQAQEEQRGQPYPERKERALKSGRPVL